MTFRVGQKVVCVDTRSDHRGSCELIQGEVYKIASMSPSKTLGGAFIRVAGGPHYGWHQSRFRPVQERKRETDISVFLAMLNPSQVTVDAMNTADFARESAG